MLKTSLVRCGLVTLWLAALLAGGAVVAAADKANVGSHGVILVLGDSLSAEYGLRKGTGWVELLSDRLRQNGADYTVVNVSISGETTSGGRSRLPTLLKQHRPRILVLQLGANDGLRGLPTDVLRDNLAAMIRAGQSAGAEVVLVGMRIPPNYGREYTERFFATYEALARQSRARLAPFLLDGFADSTEMFQADRIHPSEAAQARMLDNVWPALKPLLDRKR